ncbi:unnamed protein product, partial [Scytosiphon promiscuus]
AACPQHQNTRQHRLPPQPVGKKWPTMVVRGLACGKSPAALVAHARLTSQVFLRCDGGPASEPRASASLRAPRARHGCSSASAARMLTSSIPLAGVMVRELLSGDSGVGMEVRTELHTFGASSTAGAAAAVG